MMNKCGEEFYMEKYNIVALIGKAGSGKDAVFSALSQNHPEWNKKISCTSRAPRDYEQDGIDYHFLSADKFIDKPEQFIEKQCFNNWWYGTRISDLVPAPAINIGIFNIKGVAQILERNDISVFPILLSCSDKMRLIHQLSREENPNIQEIFRRFDADEKDFKDIPFSYNVVYNQEGLLQDTVRDMSNLINSYSGFLK